LCTRFENHRLFCLIAVQLKIAWFWIYRSTKVLELVVMEICKELGSS
jgi:hypothetical protein